ncbi:MAG TPA: transporter substrate-binding domain-containing protein [Candidatus Eisenbacteria bacterium]
MRPLAFPAIALLLAAAGCGGTPPARRASTLDRVIDTRVLRIGLNPGYAPFEMVDSSGGMIGFDIDLARRVARLVGDDVRVEIVKSDWDPIIANLNAGKFDVIVSGMTRTPQRALRCAFTTPYFTTGQALLVNRAKHPEGTVADVATLDRPGIVVATKLGTTGEIAARKFFRRASIRTMETEADAALEVEAGRADVMVYDQPYIAIRSRQSRGSTWARLAPFTHEDLAMAVRRDDVEFRDWLDLAIEDVRRSGAWDSLYTTWFVTMPWLPAGADTAAPSAAKP